MNGVVIPLNLEKSKWDLAAQELVLFTEVMQELETWCVTRAAKMLADVNQWVNLRHVRADTWERVFRLPMELEIERSRKLIGVICGDVSSR
jgi:chorismate mutase